MKGYRIIDYYIEWWADFMDILPILKDVAIIIGVILAIYTLKNNIKKNEKDDKWNQSEEYLKHANDFFQHAYNVFTDNNTLNYPKKDRIAWLTTARYILKAQNIANKIITKTHQTLYSNYEQIWRNQFTDLFTDFEMGNEKFNWTYFVEKEEYFLSYPLDDKAPISESSIATIFRFIQYPSNYKEPLDDIQELCENDLKTSKMGLYTPVVEYYNKKKEYFSKLKKKT